MTLHQVIPYIAALIGVVILVIGFIATFAPQMMAGKFGIPASGKALPYVTSTGIRDVALGIIFLYLWYQGELKTFGVACLATSLIALSDFFVVQKYGDKKISFVHLAGALATTGYGAYLIWIF